MVSLEALRGRVNRVRIQMVERVSTWASRLVEEAGRTVDLAAWRAAPTFRDRLLAVSWPRAGVGAGALAAAVGGLMVVVLSDRPDAYPPPEPSEREVFLHREAQRRATPTPPPSLVEANKSWKAP